MCIKIIEPYKLQEQVIETNRSCLYIGVRTANGEDDELLYALKEYKTPVLEPDALVYEKKITQEIENYACMSIVIPIFETIASIDGQQYAVMQFKKHGKFLSQIIEMLEEKYGVGKIPLEKVFCIIKEILTSLKVLHNFKNKEGIGILHMDIHPGNIFMESENIEEGRVGSAKFIDFSNALRMNENGVAYKEKEVISVTPGYYAPEQFCVEQELFSASADLYAVAAICYRMITGIVIDDIYKTYGEMVENATYNVEYNPVIGYMLDVFFKCALENNPKYRYQTAEAMLKTIERLEKCLQAYKEFSYYELLSVAYEMSVPQNKIDLSQVIFRDGKFLNAVQQLEKKLLQYRVDTKRCNYIFEALWKIGKQNINLVTDKVWNKLICSGIACCNHVGKHNQALELYNMLQIYKNNMPIMNYLEVTNRIAVMYADLCQYEKAYTIILSNIDSLQRIKQSYKVVANLNGIISENATKMVELGRAYSAAGSYMTLLHMDKPMDMFEKALEEFGDDKVNRNITISHILHYAIQTKQKKIYEKYATEYFAKYFYEKELNQCEEKDVTIQLEKILSNIVKQEKIDLYTLYVFLKGIYIFYIDMVNDKFLENMLEIAEGKELMHVTEHPVQLIYRYIALVFYEKNKKNKNENMQEKVEQLLYHSVNSIREGIIDLDKNLNILMIITYQGVYLYNNLTDQVEDNPKLFEMLKEHCELSEADWSALENKLLEQHALGNLLEAEYC